MARHLLIGDGTTSTGVEAAGAVGIEKLSASGPTQLVAGDTLADSMQIRFVQGTAGHNIVSPWIYGKDIINFSGQSNGNQVAEVAVATLTSSALAAGTHTLKIINLTNGAEPFEMKSYDITVTASMTPTAQTALLKTAVDANLPHWVNGAITDNGGNVAMTGFTKGAAKVDGSIQGDLVHMDFVWEAAANDTTQATTYSTVGLRGYGDGFYVEEFEQSLQGSNFGYYNRVQQPVAPTTYTATGSSYDMYSIVATKDGSSASQIHGVDNLIEINIAMIAGDADGLVFEGKLNPWMSSAGFNQVVL